MNTLLDLVTRHGAARADANGVAGTAVPGLITVRATAPGGIVHAIQRPLICLVVQGAKRVTLGTRDHLLGPGDTLLITADVPTVSQVTRASPAAPYLSLVLELDPAVIAELSAQMGPMLVGGGGNEAPSFHQHFRAVISLSPRQFHKQLRLIEARRLMAAEGLPAASAGHRVGYESASQFTRDYRRLFGTPPARDAQAARLALAA